MQHDHTLPFSLPRFLSFPPLSNADWSHSPSLPRLLATSLPPNPSISSWFCQHWASQKQPVDNLPLHTSPQLTCPGETGGLTIKEHFSHSCPVIFHLSVTFSVCLSVGRTRMSMHSSQLFWVKLSGPCRTGLHVLAPTQRTPLSPAQVVIRADPPPNFPTRPTVLLRQHS